MKLFRPRVAGAAAGLLLVAPAKMAVDAASASMTKFYSDNSCATTPIMAYMTNAAACTNTTDSACTATSNGYASSVCTNDLAASLTTMFGESSLLVRAVFTGDDCAVGTSAYALLADGMCHSTPQNHSFNIAVAEAGTAQYSGYTDLTCSSSSLAEVFPLASNDIDSGACVGGYAGFYTNVTMASEAIATFTVVASSDETGSDEDDGEGDTVMAAYQLYHENTCAGKPSMMRLINSTECTASTACSANELPGGNIYMNEACANTSDYLAYIDTTYGETQYLAFEVFEDEACTSMVAATAALADGSCYADYNEDAATYGKYTLGADGSVTLGRYSDSGCTTATTSVTVTSAQVEAGSCVEFNGDLVKVYTPPSSSTTTTTSSAPASTKLSAPLAHTVAALVALAGVVAML